MSGFEGGVLFINKTINIILVLEAEYLNLNLISITKYPQKLSDYPTPQKLQMGA